MILRHRHAAAATARRQRQRDRAAQHACQPSPARAAHAFLSRAAGAGTSRAVNAPDIFDRAARRRRRDRAAAGDYPRHAFLRAVMLDGIVERLEAVKRSFANVLDLGSFEAELMLPGARIARADPGFAFAARSGGVQVEEDHLPFADGAFDLVISAGVLDQVNDLPGALSLIRRSLRPDGLFLGAFVGAGSLGALRTALRNAEQERPAARLHPQIDVRAAGDLLMRAGFALPVADVETVNVSYRSIGGLLDDLRGMAATNLLTTRSALTRAALARAAAAFADAADADGRTHETFEIVFLTGWSPDDSQPKPARRGSGSTSLAAALAQAPRPD